jgi:cysteine desulfurase/selenocysteine lyase
VTSTSHAARLGDRALFPTLAFDAYLNHAGISPASRPVVHALATVGEDYAARGFGAWPAYNERREGLRAALARMIHARPEDLGFTSNTSAGVTATALCLPWRAGDRIVLFRGEFPANVTPWQQAALRFGLELSWVGLESFARSHEEGLAELERVLAQGPVRLVAVSAVQFQTGLAMPVRAIAERAHAHGAELFVDAVQACGVVPVDVRDGPVDYLACGAHKWLMGTEGAGFVYVHPSRVERLVPSVAGWLSHQDPVRFLLEGAGHLRYDRPIRASASMLEAGNLPTPSLAALAASVALLESLGVSAIHAHVRAYLDALEPALVDRGFASARTPFREGQSGSLCVRPPEGPSLPALHRAIVREGVACAMPDGHLRFSPHWPNALEEIPRVLAAIDRALAAGP